jgi:membrane-associated phospholipid phosphatase
VILTLLRTNWRLKLFVTMALNGFYWIGYAALGHYAFGSLRSVPLTAIDRVVPFDPEPWGWIYFSQFLFTAALPWLLTERSDIRRYSFGLVAMSLISFAIFFLFPTASPRPLEMGTSIPMRAIGKLDGPLNAFPSLHAAFIVYMGMLAWRMFGRSAPRLTIGVAVIWGGAILYSTLATKQHYVLDLLAGGAIGGLADCLAWWKSPSSTAAMTIPRSNESTSQAGIR